MKLFIDTANVDEIREVNAWGVLSGVTTNPTLIAKEGKEFIPTVREICSIVNGLVSVEAVSMATEEIVSEAKSLSSIAPNVVVKVAMTSEGLAAVKILSANGVKTNVTLVFSANQALLAATVGATFVSAFVGRLDDIGHDGLAITGEIQDIIDIHEFETEVIAASIRHPEHVTRAASLGIDIATVPYGVFRSMLRHPLTDIGIKKFLEDWEKVRQVKDEEDYLDVREEKVKKIGEVLQ